MGFPPSILVPTAGAVFDIAQSGKGQVPQTDVRNMGPIQPKEIQVMLETVAIVLLVLWGLGLVNSYTMGGLIHVLLVVAIVVILIRVIQGRRI
jgi:hypothetical protein